MASIPFIREILGHTILNRLLFVLAVVKAPGIVGDTINFGQALVPALEGGQDLISAQLSATLVRLITEHAENVEDPITEGAIPDALQKLEDAATPLLTAIHL